ncbi:O-antigen ligase family protein [bacterium]|nr:O-antigen ligase family protein [bacterium]
MNVPRFLPHIERAALFLFAAAAPISITLTQTALAVLLLAAAFRFSRNAAWEYTEIDVALLLFLAWMFVAAIMSEHRLTALTSFAGMWVHLAWFALRSANFSRRDMKTALVILAAAGALAGAYGVAQAFFGEAVPRPLAPRVPLWQPHGGYFHAVGLFDHHLTFGNTLLLVAGAAMGVIALSGRPCRKFLGAAFLLTLAGIVASYARSAWIGLAALALVPAFYRGRGVLRRAGIAAAVAVIVSVVAVFAAPGLRHRVASSLSAGGNLERWYIWQTSADVVREHPVAGIGPGAYRETIDAYRAGYNIKWTTASHAHNSFMMAAVEGGLPGLFLFVTLLLTVAAPFFFALDRAPPGSPERGMAVAFLATVAAFTIASVFQHNFGDAEVVMAFWLVAAAGRNLAVDRPSDQGSGFNV